MEAPLQPLRLLPGWKITFNSLFEIDPAADQIPANHHSWFLKEDMLQAEHQDRDRLLDVGWYPDGDLDRGEYALHVHQGDWVTERLLHEFRTRNRQSLVAEIERIFAAITEGRL